MVKRRTFKKSLGTRRQGKVKAQMVTSMVRYVQPRATSQSAVSKIEINVPVWIYATTGLDYYSFSPSLETWHIYPTLTSSTELNKQLNSYIYYRLNGCSIAFVKTYNANSTNEIRSAPPLAFNVGPPLATSQVSNLTKGRIFDMDDSYRIQPLNDQKNIDSRYYKFTDMDSGHPASYPQSLGRWQNTFSAPVVLLSLGSKENPVNLGDANITIGTVLLTLYFSFKKAGQVNNY